MLITGSKNVPQRFSGLLVLLIESDKKSLHRHANQLLLHSHRVTRTTKASIGLSKILDGDTFHCVLIDAEKSAMDIIEFLYCSLKNQPQLPIVVIGSVDTQKQINSLAQEYKVVSFLRKPYADEELCNILKHISEERMSRREGSSTIKRVEENLESNIVQKVDTTSVGSSASSGANMICNNSLSLGDGTDRGLMNISSHEYGVMSQPITIVDMSRNDYQPSVQKSICIGTEKAQDKGKKPMEIKRKKYLSVEDNTYLKRRKEIETHTAWMPLPLDDDSFTEALNLNALDEEEYCLDTILQDIDLPGLTRSNHVTSHPQEYIEKENNMKKPGVLSSVQKGDNLKAESFSYTSSWIPTPSDNNTSIPESSNLQRQSMLNSYGVSFMTIDSIRTKLNEVAPFNLPQKSRTFMTNSGGVVFQPIRGDTYSMSSGFRLAENIQSCTRLASEAQLTTVCYGNTIEPLITGESFSNRVSGKEMTPLDVGAHVVPLFDIRTDDYIYLNDFANASSFGFRGSIVRESFAPFDRFGVPVDQHLLNAGYVITGSSKVGSEKLYFRNMESLFIVDSSKTPDFSETDKATIGDVSHFFGISGSENNAQTQTKPPVKSSVHLNSSASRLSEDHWSQKMIQHQPEIFTEDVNEDCGHLITGPFGYTEDIVEHLLILKWHGVPTQKSSIRCFT